LYLHLYLNLNLELFAELNREKFERLFKKLFLKFFASLFGLLFDLKYQRLWLSLYLVLYRQMLLRGRSPGRPLGGRIVVPVVGRYYIWWPAPALHYVRLRHAAGRGYPAATLSLDPFISRSLPR